VLQVVQLQQQRGPLGLWGQLGMWLVLVALQLQELFSFLMQQEQEQELKQEL